MPQPCYEGISLGRLHPWVGDWKVMYTKKMSKKNPLGKHDHQAGGIPNEFLIVCKTISVGLGTFGGGVYSEWVRHNFKYSTYLGRKIALPKGTFINLRNWKFGLECGRSVRLRQKISTKTVLSGWYLDGAQKVSSTQWVVYEIYYSPGVVNWHEWKAIQILWFFLHDLCRMCFS